MQALGDYAEDAMVDFKWSTNLAAGGSVTRATDGTVVVYKGNGTTESTAGRTDTEDFNSQTGIHHCRIDLSADAFYATGYDYQVVLQGAVIDGQTVNAVIASFSIEHRYMRGTQSAALASVCTETRLSELDAATAGKMANQVDEVRNDTEDLQNQIGAAGAGLSAIPWNSAWDAEEQDNVQAVVEANNLDHLLKLAVDVSLANTVHNNSVMGYALAKSDVANFNRNYHSQFGIYDSIPTRCVSGLTVYDAATGTDVDNAIALVGVNTAHLTDIKGTGFDKDTHSLPQCLTADIANLYHADIQVTIDEANSKDEYTATWFKNGLAVTSGITNPKIQVVKRADGTDLIAQTDMTQIGSTGSYKYDEATKRVTAGEAVVAIVSATIDGSMRSFRKLLTRDSSAA